MTVKETYCSVRNLVPNTQYEFWVTAQNRAGLSPASERAMYMTGNGGHRSHGFRGVAGHLISCGRAGVAVHFSLLVHQTSVPRMEGTFAQSWSQNAQNYCSQL